MRTGKKNWLDRMQLAAALVMTVMFCLLIAHLCRQPGAELPSSSLFSPVSFQGEYSVDGGAWQPLTSDTVFDTDRLHTVRARGHFTHDIEKNQLLMLRLTDLRAVLSVNGGVLFSFGTQDQLQRGTRSGGNVWASFSSPGILTSDYVELELGNVYVNVHSLSFREFFDQMYYGSAEGLWRMALRQSGSALAVALVTVVVGLFELIAAAVQVYLRERGAERTFYSGGLAAFGGLWFLIQFNIASLIFPYPAAVNAVDVLSAYLMSAFFGLYISTYLKDWRRKAARVGCTVTLTAVVAVMLTTLSDILDPYDMVPFGWTLAIVNLSFSAALLLLEYRKSRSREVRGFTLSLIPVAVGVLLDFTGWFSGVNDTGWLRLFFLVFIFIQLFSTLLGMREHSRKTVAVQQLENEIIQSQVAVMLSQIQPHFLYNALNAIQYLCETQPPKAAEAIRDFSAYLRGNMDSLSRKTPIPFSVELDHLKHYLAIELLRFDSLRIEYDLAVTDFTLPALTVQPMVENAIRYGVTRRRDRPGVILISTREDKAGWIVTIADNGVGFDPAQAPDGSRSHIGISNTRSRLAAMCGATLAVESTPGEGTRVTITLPKGDKGHARDPGGR